MRSLVLGLAIQIGAASSKPQLCHSIKHHSEVGVSNVKVLLDLFEIFFLYVTLGNGNRQVY